MDAVDGNRDALGGVARSQEVPVHGMHRPVIRHGPFGGDQRLGQHLPAVDSPGRHRVRSPGEDVLRGARLTRVKIEDIEQASHGGGPGVVGHTTPFRARDPGA